MRVDVQVGEVHRDIVAKLGDIVGFFIVDDGLKSDASGFKRVGIGCLEVGDK